MLGLAGHPAAATQGDPVIAGELNDATAATLVDSSAGVVDCSLPLGANAGVVGCGAVGLWGIGTTYGVYANAPQTALVAEGGSIGVDTDGSSTGLMVSGGAYGIQASGGDTGLIVAGRIGVDAGGSDYGVNASGDVAGVRAESRSQSGVALDVEGRSVFRTAGVALVPAGATTVTVVLRSVTATDFVLATVQGNPGVSVMGAKAGSGQFRIWLTSPPAVDTIVAYFVITRG